MTIRLLYIPLITVALLCIPYRLHCQDTTGGMQCSYGTASTGRYAENSVLGSGEWIKIRVSQNGIYKITYEQLVAMGVSAPENVRIYGYGGGGLSENFKDRYTDDLPPIGMYINKGDDNTFNKGDYILFYAQGPISWSYDYTANSLRHTVNPYSDYGYYFITSSKGTSDNMQYAKQLEKDNDETIDYYNDCYLHETDRINILSSGKMFFNEEFNSTNQSHSFTANIPDIVPNSHATIEISAAQKANSSEKISVQINNSAIGALTLNKLENNAKIAVARNIIPFTATSDNFNISLTYSNRNQLAYLDYFVLNTKRYLKKTNTNPLYFCFADKVSMPGNYEFQISGTDNNTMVWDVTDITDIRIMHTTTTNSITSFVDKVNIPRQYVAFNPKSDQFPTPTVIGRIPNQNLHAESQADMIIISHSDFMNEAHRLAKAHNELDGMNVVVADAENVYNEFSSGTPDATAYRRFAKMFYDRATSETSAPKYLLLFGDGSFDNRQILKANTDKNIYRLLTYQTDNSYSDLASVVTDDYFCFLDDSDGRNISANSMDMAVGRIPAYTIEQAKAVVDKTIRYMQNEEYGTWKNQGIFLADDGDGNDHIEGSDSTCNLTQQLYPDFLTRKLFFDSYKQESSASGESYPILRKEFMDYISSGVLMINYMGHGGYNGWANEQILKFDDVANMYNTKLPLFYAATCNFSRFDDFLESTGERLVTHANGGAIATISAARTVITRQNNLLNFEFAKEILNSTDGRPNTIGYSLMQAKNRRAKNNDINRLSYTILGDPAVRPNYPTSHTVIIDTINDKAIKSTTDTVGALDMAVFKGYVSDKTSDKETADVSFNGYVNVKVFDKQQTLTTLANDADSRPYSYTYRSTPIYTGQVMVTNGRFEVRFIVPKDIKYNFGAGIVIMYAADPERGFEGNGHCNNLIIGGENPDIEWENDGPEISMYLNSNQFKNGDRVNENPLFVANISDKSGINTVGTGFGHDIILKLDNDPQQEYILNSYYESVYGRYDKGHIHYQLTDLQEGKHTLYFRVWDMQNNSSSAQLDFEVVKGLAPEVNNLTVYPNPVKGQANIIIENDRPNQPAEVYVYVYDFSGKMVWTNNGYYTTDTSNRITMQWDINDAGSRGIANGLYLVKAVMTDTNGEKDKKTTKILVQRQ
ncbi:MAG: type IX secretion system sortase PorU [Candidatus Aphodosoma sp.]